MKKLDFFLRSYIETAYRAFVMGIGISLAGEKKSVVKKSIIASLAVESFVIGWSAYTLKKPDATLPSITAVQTGQLAPIIFTWLARSAMVAAGLHLAGEQKNVWRNSLAATAAVELPILVHEHFRKLNAGRG